MDTAAKTDSIKNILSGIVSKRIVLPEFQRDFVWEIGKTFDLFDSLVKNIFVGSIIYGVPSFEITIREIDSRPRSGKGSRNKLITRSLDKDQINIEVKTKGMQLLLDGQQRLTSIYRALTGVDTVYFITKNRTDYKDYEKSENDYIIENSLESILLEFSGQESPDRLSIKLSDVYDMMEHNYMESEKREKFFTKLEYPKAFGEEEKTEIFRNYLSLTNKLMDFFKSEKLLSYYLLDTTIEKFALFFERSNSRGIQLNFIDILAAKLYRGFNLREKISEFEDKNHNYVLNKEIIVRAISFIVSKGKEIDRSYILGNLTAEHFTKHWQPVCELFVKTLDFLYKNNFIITQNWIPYENMLIPLMMFLQEINVDFSQMDEKQNRFLRFWYWASIFAQRYTGSSNEVIIQDSLILKKIAKGEKISDRNYFFKLRNQIGSEEELHSFTKKGSVIYRGILNLINFNAKGLLDWTNTNKLSFNQSKIDDHHIFPRNYLVVNYSDNEDILALTDSVVNKTLIPKITNIKIGQKSPSVYLQELKLKNPNLEESLENHSIPRELIQGEYDNEYMFFLQMRAEQIFKVIKSHTVDIIEDIRQQFYEDNTLNMSEKKMPVFANYQGKTITAEYEYVSQRIYYKNKYYSPSGAAVTAKKEISGKETTENGWDFWFYTDDKGEKKSLQEIRNRKEVI